MGKKYHTVRRFLKSSTIIVETERQIESNTGKIDTLDRYIYIYIYITTDSYRHFNKAGFN
jgi:hypothetical protein